MRRPKILQQLMRRVVRAPERVLSDYLVRFTGVEGDGTVKAEASVPRNRLGRLIELARSKALYGLPTIGVASTAVAWNSTTTSCTWRLTISTTLAQRRSHRRRTAFVSASTRRS